MLPENLVFYDNIRLVGFYSHVMFVSDTGRDVIAVARPYFKLGFKAV